MRRPTYQINQPRKRRSGRLFVLLLILCVVIGAYLYYRHVQTLDKQAQQKAQDEAQTDSAKKPSSTKNGPPLATNTPTNPVKQNVPESSDSVTITSFSESNNVVESSAKLSSGDGSCVFTYTPDGDKPVIDTVNSASGVCTTKLSANTFSRLGIYNLNVTVYINGKKTEANQSVTIN